MSTRKILNLFLAAFVLVEARWRKQKRDTSGKTSICDINNNIHRKILCYCIKDFRQIDFINSADCFLAAEDIQLTDDAWDTFEELKSSFKITFTNLAGITLEYIPTPALRRTDGVVQLEVKYGSIEKIHGYAFANLSDVEEISVIYSQVNILEKHAFAHHRNLIKITLENNSIAEINKDVFIDLPSLEKLTLTGNQIIIIRDEAFIHLTSLKELDINKNILLSLNNQTFFGLSNLERLDLGSNNLEYIEDNTFRPLKNLLHLNLDHNQILMLEYTIASKIYIYVSPMMDRFYPENWNSEGTELTIEKLKKNECSPWGIGGQLVQFAAETIRDAIKGEVGPAIRKGTIKVVRYAANAVKSVASSTLSLVSSFLGLGDTKKKTPICKPTARTVRPKQTTKAIIQQQFTKKATTVRPKETTKATTVPPIKTTRATTVRPKKTTMATTVPPKKTTMATTVTPKKTTMTTTVTPKKTTMTTTILPEKTTMTRTVRPRKPTKATTVRPKKKFNPIRPDDKNLYVEQPTEKNRNKYQPGKVFEEI